MKTKLIYIIITLSLLTGCRTPQTIIQYVPVHTVRDSIVERIVRDTVTAYPPQTQTVTGTRQSHLETDLAVSDAAVDSVGMLYHNITNKGYIPSKYITITTVVHDSISVPYPVKGDPYPVEVIKIVYKRDLIWWAGLLLFSISLIYFIIKIIKLKKKIIP